MSPPQTIISLFVFIINEFDTKEVEFRNKTNTIQSRIVENLNEVITELQKNQAIRNYK